jgi:wyosine [tRNA(Phe)-imidazoG37] synthetase (radical SAM superfamily)
MIRAGHTLNFQDHRRELDGNRYVYAVVSRRSRGLSIGINLNPDKVCNFDCPYCQVDRTTPGGERSVDIPRLRTELSHLFKLIASGELWSVPPFDTARPELRRVNDIAFAGDGEPTSCPTFPEAVACVGELRAKYNLQAVSVCLLTNATLLQRPRVQSGLAALDAIGGEIWAKLDAGTEPYFHLTDGTRLPFRRILDNIHTAALARPIVLQCMFMTWENEGPSDDEIEAWAGRIDALLAAGGQIRLVQVYSVARHPADDRVDALPTDRLEQIAAAARAVIARHGADTEVAVYPGIAQQ